MTYGSLFSGIGGFDLALDQAGFDCQFQAESNSTCRSILAKHWPNVARFDDVRSVTGESVRPVRLLAGGFPCQDISVAGHRAGLSGSRSCLWWEFHRIIGELSPEWVLAENVAGLLSGCGCPLCGVVAQRIKRHAAAIPDDQPDCRCRDCRIGRRLHDAHSGRNLQIVIASLAKLGYGVAWRVCDSQYWGVPQRRRRVFIVGHSGGQPRRAAEVLFERDCLPWDSPPSRKTGTRVAHAIAAGSGGSKFGSGRDGQDDFVTSPIPGHHPRNDAETAGSLIASALGSTQGGPDDDSAQANHIVASTLRSRQSSPGVGMPGRGGEDDQNLVFQCHGTNVGPMGTLRTGNGNETGGVPFTFDPRQVTSNVNRTKAEPDLPCNTLNQDGMAVAFAQNQEGYIRTGDVMHSLNTNSNSTSRSAPTVMTSGVRRLTPRECERLQAFPDDWTRYGADGKEISDSARYQAIGNAVTVSTVAWIAKRIMEVSRERL